MYREMERLKNRKHTFVLWFGSGYHWVSMCCSLVVVNRETKVPLDNETSIGDKERPRLFVCLFECLFECVFVCDSTVGSRHCQDGP